MTKFLGQFKNKWTDMTIQTKGLSGPRPLH